MNITKQFFKYVIPSTISFLLAGVYCFTDAFFVGNSIGDCGIAAINIGFSALAIMQALGSGIGIGASVLYSTNIGAGKTEEAEKYIKISYILMIIFSVIITLPLTIFPVWFLRILGASETIAQVGKPYFRIIAAATIIQMFATGLCPIVRNYGSPNTAMIAMIAGLCSNIFMDWLFVMVLPFGMSGAAWASVLAQVISLGICLIYLIGRKNKMRIKITNFKPYAKQIGKVGISPFGLTMIPNISVIIMNRCSLVYGGDEALGAYGCIAYLMYIIELIVQGIDDGAQPLISLFSGAEDVKAMKKVQKLSMECALSVAIISAILSTFNGYSYGIFMGASERVSGIIGNGMRIFALGMPFAALSRTLASNFYSAGENTRSYIISYAEPVFILIFTIFFPRILGQTGVWWSNTLGQICVTSIAVLLRKKPQIR